MRVDSIRYARGGLLLTLAALLAVSLIVACSRGQMIREEDDEALSYVFDQLDGLMEPDRLREFMTPELSARTRATELLRSIHCFPAEAQPVLVHQRAERTGDETAQIVATHEITMPLQGGANDEEGAMEVTRVWEFELRDGTWLLSSLPPCPDEVNPTPTPSPTATPRP
jgi:hypothetical protein